ncbi:MAG: hypothetical protein NVS3B26_28150 [Mycobacteriales bacterium]
MPLVAALSDIDGEQVELVIDGLVEAHLLARERPLRFVHPLVQSALYRHMPSGLQSRRHRETARLLSLAGAPPDEVARHLLRCLPARDPWVLERLRSAGLRALENGAPDVATAFLRRAMEEEPTTDPELALRLGLAESLVRDGAAIGHLQQAFDFATTAVQRASAALPLARLLAYRRRYAEALAVVDAALATVHPAERETRLKLSAERLWLLESSDVPGADFVTAAEALARGLTGKTHGERLALAHLGAARLFAGASQEEVRALVCQALGEGRLLREEGPDSPSWLYAASLLWVVGDYTAAEHEMLRGEQVAFDRGSVAPLVQIHGARAWLSWEIGELDRAEGLARDALGRTRGPGSTGARYATSCLVTVLTERGALMEAATTLSAAPMTTTQMDRFDALLLHARAELKLAEGDDSGGVADLLAVGRWCDSRSINSPGEWAWRTDVAPALARIGDTALARTLAHEEVQRARRFGVPRPLGRALHAQALVGDPKERLPLLNEAVAVLSSSPARLATAKALVHLGVTFRTQGQVKQAQAAFRSALDLAASCGAALVAEDVRRLLIATGARPRRTALIGPESLTASEREVALLAADGHSNREIAERLYVSVKAVEKHLRNAYNKLGIDRRTELSAALNDCPIRAV